MHRGFHGKPRYETKPTEIDVTNITARSIHLIHAYFHENRC